MCLAGEWNWRNCHAWSAWGGDWWRIGARPIRWSCCELGSTTQPNRSPDPPQCRISSSEREVALFRAILPLAVETNQGTSSRLLLHPSPKHLPWTTPEKQRRIQNPKTISIRFLKICCWILNSNVEVEEPLLTQMLPVTDWRRTGTTTENWCCFLEFLSLG